MNTKILSYFYWGIIRPIKSAWVSTIRVESSTISAAKILDCEVESDQGTNIYCGAIKSIPVDLLRPDWSFTFRKVHFTKSPDYLRLWQRSSYRFSNSIVVHQPLLLCLFFNRKVHIGIWSQGALILFSRAWIVLLIK